MLKLKIEVIGSTAWNGAFIGVSDQIEDMTGVWRTVQDSMFTIFNEQFSSEGGKGASGKWKPLNPAYAAIKSAIYGDQQILVASGRMKASLTGRTADTVADFQPQEATFGTNVPYARKHQTGEGVPVRRIVDLSADQSRFLHKEIHKELVAEMRRDPSIRAGGVKINDTGIA